MINLKRSPEMLAAIQRTKEAEEKLKEDLVRVCCWIEERHSEQPVSIELQRHYGCADNEIAHVVPLVRDRGMRRAIRAEAEAAFKAVARSLRQAVEPDPRAAGALPSTKGAL